MKKPVFQKTGLFKKPGFFKNPVFQKTLFFQKTRFLKNPVFSKNWVFQKTGLNCFADDTGLEVKALNGRPGVHSARYAGPNCNAVDNMDKLLSELKSHDDRSAKFRTVISLILNGEKYYFEGEVLGDILSQKKGVDGFGYDPIFRPIGYKESFAEMSIAQKNVISHRGLAVKKLVEFLAEL